MRPLSPRKEVDEMRFCDPDEDGGGGGIGEEGLRSSVTCTSEPEVFAAPQAAQKRDIEQQIAKVIALDNGAVDRDHKDAIAILRHITQHFAQVS